MPVLRIPTPLRSYTNGQSEVNVSGSNISDALTDLTTQYPALKPHHLERWREALPHAEVVPLEAGHWPHEEKPDALCDAVTDFVVRSGRLS